MSSLLVVDDEKNIRRHLATFLAGLGHRVLVAADAAEALARTFGPILRLLENTYYMDWINEHLIAPAARALGHGLWKGGDLGLIDGVAINGSAAAINGVARVMRLLQTGRLYWYAMVMLLGVFGLLTWRIWPNLAPAISSFWGR